MTRDEVQEHMQRLAYAWGAELCELLNRAGFKPPDDALATGFMMGVVAFDKSLPPFGFSVVRPKGETEWRIERAVTERATVNESEEPQ